VADVNTGAGAPDVADLAAPDAADLTAPDADDSGGSGAPGTHDAGSRDRAQLLLVAGLVVAVMIVMLALTLNTVIYAEYRATRGSDIAGDDALRFLEATEDGIGGILEAANRDHDGSHATLRANVTDAVDAWGNATGRSVATTGVATHVSKRTLTNGTRMLQTDASRNFTAADGAANWTLAAGVSARRFRLAVRNASLATATNATVGSGQGVFHVHLNDQSSSRWRAFIYRDPNTNTVNVTVRNDAGGTVSESEPCSATAEHVLVDITDGTVGGESCPALSFASALQSPYAITYNETETGGGTETAAGTYHLIVDDGSVTRTPGPEFNDAPGNSPWADAVVYAASYDVVYETARLRYNASVRIAPGEADG
jgi:hypothetical protein